MRVAAEPGVGWQPGYIVAAVAGVGVVFAAASAPILDEDIWWHVLIGQQIAETWQFSALGNAWAPFGNQDWTTTQWLSELVYGVLHALGGWSGVTSLRVAIAALTVSAIAVTVLPRRQSLGATLIFVVVVAGIALWLSRDRPQALVLPLAVVLARWLHSSLRGYVPPWWQVALVTALWSNLHGSWLLVPGVFALATACRLLDGEALSRHLLVLVVVSTAAGLANPTTFTGGLLAIPRFATHTSDLVEWGHTPLLSSYGAMLMALMAAIVIAWSRPGKVPRSEILIVLSMSAFGLVAIRNVPLALILLAPVAADRVSSALPGDRNRGEAERAMLRVIVAGIAAVGLAAATLAWSRVDPLAGAPSASIVRALPAGSETRVLNEYALGGFLAAQGPAGTQVVIDGRADRYSLEYKGEYFAALRSLTDWQEFVQRTNPDVAVLATTTPLSVELELAGWKVLERDSGVVVLARPAQVTP